MILLTGIIDKRIFKKSYLIRKLTFTSASECIHLNDCCFYISENISDELESEFCALVILNVEPTVFCLSYNVLFEHAKNCRSGLFCTADTSLQSIVLN
jgi:hypothetical protein